MTYSFTQLAWHLMEVSGQVPAPATLPQGKVPIEWLGSRAGPDAWKKRIYLPAH